MLAAPNFLTFITEFESVQKHRNSSDVQHKESLQALERHFVIDVASFMRVLIDHASPFLDAVHVVIDTGDVMGAWSYSQRDWMWSAWIVCAWKNLPSTIPRR